MTDPGELKKSLRFFLIVVVILAIGLVSFPLWEKWRRPARETGFTAADLRFVEYEGGPVAARPYQAGDEVHVSFRLENVPRNSEGRADTMLTFLALDPDGRPLRAPTQSPINGPEESVPISYHFTLPLYALGGAHVIRIEADDRVSGRKFSRTAEFHVIGPKVAPGVSLGIQDHVFQEAEGGPPMAEASYKAGMKIRTGFNVVGFRVGPQNRIKLRVDLGILSAQGEPLLDEPNVVAIDQDLFYPPLYMPVTTSVRSPEEMPAGTYRMKYTLHDDVSGQALSLEQPFTIR